MDNVINKTADDYLKEADAVIAERQRVSNRIHGLVGQPLVSEAWDMISELLVGMKTTDPRWGKASKWLNENRAYQITKPRLPNAKDQAEREIKQD